jgi:Na+-driven multidrug efflux pump
VLILLLILASLVVGVTLAFFLEYIHKMKTRETEKIALLKRYLSIRGK